MDIVESQVYERLINASIRFVSYRMRSEKEIRDFLAKTLLRHHTTAPGVVTHVMERLRELGYVNDDAFAQWWVGQRTGRKSKGARIIRTELIQKGVDPDCIDAAIHSGMKGERSEKELVKIAAEKKLERWTALPQLVRKRKLIEYLTRRGFSSDTVWSVVDDVLKTV